MTRSPFRHNVNPALPVGGQRCYYWVCASIMMDADDRTDPQAVTRVHAALSCAQSDGCVRAADCRELTLGALGRLLRQRPRG
ncbi:MAG: hypothetical protein ACM3Q1_17250 [Bacteroidales bacterium]